MRDAHRKSRLAYLIATDYANRSDFLAKNAWCSKSRLSQALGKSQPFAEDAAALWEERLHLESGWFNNNWPTPKEQNRSLGHVHSKHTPEFIEVKVSDLEQEVVAMFRRLPGESQRKVLTTLSKGVPTNAARPRQESKKSTAKSKAAAHH
jgi:hypothetical protein